MRSGRSQTNSLSLTTHWRLSRETRSLVSGSARAIRRTSSQLATWSAYPHPQYADPMARNDDLKAAILVVEDESEARAMIRGELERRYGSDYHVTCQGSAVAALAKLERWRDEGKPVALVLADQWMPDLTGEEFLARAQASCTRTPSAPCWWTWVPGATARPPTRSLRAMALGQIDYYVLKPWRAPDEFFHRTVTEFLHEWTRASAAAPAAR